MASGKAVGISELDSGNYIYIGKCPECNGDIRRVVPRNSHKKYPDPWMRHMPKGISLE